MANWSIAAQSDPGPAMRSPMASMADWAQIRAQEESSRALAAQRQAMEADHRFKLEQAQREAQQADQLRGLQSWTPETVYPIVGPEAGAKILEAQDHLKGLHLKTMDGVRSSFGATIGGLQALPTEELKQHGYELAAQKYVEAKLLKPEDIEPYRPGLLDQLQQQALTADQQVTTAEMGRHNTAAEREASATHAETARHNAAMELPKAPEAGSLADHLDGVARAKGLQSGRQLDPRTKSAAIRQYEALKRGPDKDTEPLQAVMGADGKPVLVRRSEAIGRTPASVREQGRQVTSGDAGMLAEFNSALDDIGAVRSVLQSPGKTGAGPSAESYVPNFVTSMTGLGTEAKQTQATIDRVKQVIGKTLEGGVLRKEDEAKYEKILPTISDSAPIVATKLDGLEKAIQRKKQRQIDALENAGYDTSKFGATKAAPAAAAPVSGPAKIGRFVVEVH